MVLAAPIHKIVIFGDSLSDEGNLYRSTNQKIPPSPPYFEGRFSNGPIWAELLAKKLFPSDPTRIDNFAFGGAAISTNGEEADTEDLFSLNHEINTHYLLNDDKADPDSLYIFWIGSNNYLFLYPSDDIDTMVNEVNDSLKKSLITLVDKGAKHILVLNVPDLSRTPSGAEDPVNQPRLVEAVNKHNALLASNLQNLKETYPDVDWISFDTFDEVSKILDHPEEYGFNNVSIPCNSFEVEKKSSRTFVQSFKRIYAKRDVESACEGALFFDVVHPTTQAHELIAQHMQALIDAQGFTFDQQPLSVN